jgi:hypothetical protein
MKVWKNVLSLFVAFAILFSSSQTVFAKEGAIYIGTQVYWRTDGSIYCSVEQFLPGPQIYIDPDIPTESVAYTMYPASRNEVQAYCYYSDISVDVPNKIFNVNDIQYRYLYNKDWQKAGMKSDGWLVLGDNVPGWTYKFSGNCYVSELDLESELTIELAEGASIETFLCMCGGFTKNHNASIRLKNCKFTIDKKMYYGAGQELTGEISYNEFCDIVKGNCTRGVFTYYKETAADGSKEGEPLGEGNILVDASGSSLGYVVTGDGTAEYVGTDEDKTKEALKIEDTVKDLSGNIYCVTAIKSKAMKNNKKLKSLTIGSNVNTIGSQAFMGCSKLKNVSLCGDSIKKIEKNAFKKIKKKAKFTIFAGKRNAAEKLLKKINKTGGAKDAKHKYKKLLSRDFE